MRTIPIVGAAVCYPPLATGVTYYASESAAYWFVKNLEATYLRPTDAVSDARSGELAAYSSFAAAVAWANLSGPTSGGRLPIPIKTPYRGVPPTPAQVAAGNGWPGYQMG